MNSKPDQNAQPVRGSSDRPTGTVLRLVPREGREPEQEPSPIATTAGASGASRDVPGCEDGDDPGPSAA